MKNVAQTGANFLWKMAALSDVTAGAKRQLDVAGKWINFSNSTHGLLTSRAGLPMPYLYEPQAEETEPPDCQRDSARAFG